MRACMYGGHVWCCEGVEVENLNKAPPGRHALTSILHVVPIVHTVMDVTLTLELAFHLDLRVQPLLGYAPHRV